MWLCNCKCENQGGLAGKSWRRVDMVAAFAMHCIARDTLQVWAEVN